MHRNPTSTYPAKILIYALLGCLIATSPVVAQVPIFRNEVIDLNEAPRRLQNHVIDFDQFMDGSISFRMDFNEGDAQYFVNNHRLDTIIFPSLINGRVIGEYENGLLYQTNDGQFPTKTYTIDRASYDTTLLFNSYNPSTVVHRFADGRTLIASDSFYVIGDEPTEFTTLAANDNAGHFAASTIFGDRFVCTDFQQTIITDGTMEGTDTLINVRSEFDSRQSYEHNGRLFIPTPSGELYVSDGTAIGTGVLIDENSTTSSLSNSLLVPTLTILDSAVVYLGYSQRGPQLVASDGTRAGTRSLGTIYNGSFAASRRWAVYRAGPNGRELWRTDGTEANTAVLLDFRDRNVTDQWLPRPIGTTSDGTLYFETNENGSILWALTVEGVLTEITTLTTGFGRGPQYIIAGDQLFAFYRNDFSGLYIHTPGESELTLIAEIASPGGYTTLDQGVLVQGETEGFDPQPITVLHYQGRTTVYPQHIGMNVSSERPASGTLSLAQNGDLLTGISFDTELGEAVVEINLQTGAYDAFADIHPHTLGSEVYNLRASTGAAFFEQGETLYGTTNGIQYDSLGQLPRFSSSVSIPGQQMRLYYGNSDWLFTDGTPLGTTILAGAGQGLVTDVIAHQSDYYYLSVHHNDQDQATLLLVRRSGPDGQPTTVREFSANSSTLSRGRYSLASSGGQVYFNAYTEAGGWEIWGTDGTSDGTLPLLPYTSFADGFYAQELTGGDGFVTFFTSTRTFRMEGGSEYILWEDDDELQSFPSFRFPNGPSYIRCGASVYFTADGRLHQMQRGTTAPDTILDREFGFVYYPAKLNETQILLLFSATGGLKQDLIRYDLENGDTTVLINALRGSFDNRPPPYVVQDSIVLVVRAWQGTSRSFDEVRLVNLNSGSSVLARSEGGLSTVDGIASDGNRLLYIDDTYIYGQEVYTINFSSDNTVSGPELLHPFDIPIQIYPNPTSDDFQLSVPYDRKLRYSLVNAWGQVVRSGAVATSVTITSSGLPSGTYFLRIIDPKVRQATVRRVIISR